MGSITDGEPWMEMIKSRHLTSHTYNQALAQEIAAKILARHQPALLDFSALMERFHAIRPGKSRFGLASNQIDATLLVLRRHSNIFRAIVCGSRFKEHCRPGSDIDLALQGVGLVLTDLLCIANELYDLLLPATMDLLLFEWIIWRRFSLKLCSTKERRRE